MDDGKPRSAPTWHGPGGNYLLGYAMEANLTTKLVARRLILLVIAVMALAVAVLAGGDGEILVLPCVAGAVLLVVILVFGLLEFREMAVAEDAGTFHPVRVVLVVTLGFAGYGLLAVGVGAPPAQVQLLLVMAVVIIAVLWSLPMIAFCWLLCLGINLAVNARAGALGEIRPTLVFAATAALSALVVRVVAGAAFTALIDWRHIAEAAQATLPAEDLSGGLQLLLPFVTGVAGGSGAAAHLVASEAGVAELVAAEGGPEVGPSTDAVVRAAGTPGLSIDSGWAHLAVPTVADQAAVVSLELGAGAPKATSPVRAELALVLVQLENLVNRTRSIERLQAQARTDALTGLPNRRALFEEIGQRLGQSPYGRGRVVLAMIDVDNFKAYNDAHGHLVGDDALRAAAGAIRQTLGRHDVVARFGGEEFCVLFAGDDQHGAVRALDRCRAALAAVEMPGAPLTFSAGVADGGGEESVDDVLRRADHALYRAKAEGRDRACIFGAGDQAGAGDPSPAARLRRQPRGSEAVGGAPPPTTSG